MTLVLSPFFRNAALGNTALLWYHDANRKETPFPIDRKEEE